MKSGIQGGDATGTVEEPALVTALVAPLLKLRAALGDGTRPADTALSALSAVTDTVRASDDTHRGGLNQLASTETAAAAVPVIGKTNTEVSGLADTSESLAPLLSSAYTIRDKAAADLDTLIAGFRSQATPLVKSARSQADLDPVVSLAADYVRDGVDVAKKADGQMDTLTGKVKDIAGDSPDLTVPGTVQTGDTGGSNQQPGNSQYPNPGNTQYGGGTNGYGSNNGWNSNYGNGWNSNTSNYSGGSNYGSDYTNSRLAQTNPELAAQLTIQSALLSAGVTLGSALITGAVTLGSSLIEKGATVITTGIEKGEAYAEKQLAANTSQQTGAGTTPPGATTPGTQGGTNLTPGLADPTPTTTQPTTTQPGTTPKPADYPSGSTPTGGDQGTTPAPAAQPAQPQAGVPDGGGTVVPPITGKPQPDNSDTKKRDGQAGVTPTAPA
ncbi:hypothetical protein [Nocardia niigatensis]